jgi:hypothetical protein
MVYIKTLYVNWFRTSFKIISIYIYICIYIYIHPNSKPQEMLWVWWSNVSYKFVSLAEIDFLLNESVTHNIKHFTPTKCYACSNLQATFRKQFISKFKIYQHKKLYTWMTAINIKYYNCAFPFSLIMYHVNENKNRQL